MHLFYLQEKDIGICGGQDVIFGSRLKTFKQGLTGSRYPTRPDLFFDYPTRPVPKIENDRVAGNKYFILTAIWHSIG